MEVSPFELRSTARPLRTCWVLADHWDHDRGRRTSVGDVVNQAKTYDGDPGDPYAARDLAALMASEAASLVRRGLMANPDLVAAVPANPAKKPHNLPEVLAAALGEALGAAYDPALVRKVRVTPFAKTMDADEITAALDGAFVLSASVVGKVVMVVDDLVRSGATLRAVGSVLLASGARPESFAYVATRAVTGMRT